MSRYVSVTLKYKEREKQMLPHATELFKTATDARTKDEKYYDAIMELALNTFEREILSAAEKGEFHFLWKDAPKRLKDFLAHTSL